ncbi:hypothetical protein BKE38_10085 [Pseudoroseomonas deserti]|uniref:Uncharacterized protein n=1 Tax=Teichococcus deserti TaxID=1817963 RepID=A0A1V2H3R5_9PROT|nr:hypothetical protein [Pseudoroseomonas deserti]ONG54711.1 hypothetical protein BKE38_10085 [Pseudoroseomonas deserti]
MNMADEWSEVRTAAETLRPPTQVAPRHTRRLSDKILIAFHQACDQSDFEVAEELLRILETMVTRRPSVPDQNRRKNMETLVAAHERLWLLRHPEPGN